MLKCKNVAFVLFFAVVLSVNLFAGEIRPIVDTEWVNSHIQDSSLVLIDVRKQSQDYYKGHIPGAVLVEEPKMTVRKTVAGKELKGYLPGKEYFETFLKSLGVSDNSYLVLYSSVHGNKNTKYVTRLYWQLKVFGFDKVSIIDGGFKKWVMENRPVEKGAGRQPVSGTVRLKDPDRNMVYDTQNVIDFMKDNKNLLVDFRDFASYLGSKKSDDVLDYGHIPSGYAMPEELFFNDDGTFVSVGKIKGLASALNISPDKTIAIYCNTGNHAAEGWFILHELLGKEDVKLYDGSLTEWTNLGHKLVKYRVDNYD